MSRAVAFVTIIAAISPAGAYRIAHEDPQEDSPDLAVEVEAQPPNSTDNCWRDLRLVAADAVKPFERYSREITGFCHSTREALDHVGMRSLPAVAAVAAQCAQWLGLPERPPSAEMWRACDLPPNATEGEPSPTPPSSRLQSSAAECWRQLTAASMTFDVSLEALDTFCADCRSMPQLLIAESVHNACESLKGLEDRTNRDDFARMPDTCPWDLGDPAASTTSRPALSPGATYGSATTSAGGAVVHTHTGSRATRPHPVLDSRWTFVFLIIVFILAMACCGEATKRRRRRRLRETEIARGLVESDDSEEDEARLSSSAPPNWDAGSQHLGRSGEGQDGPATDVTQPAAERTANPPRSPRTPPRTPPFGPAAQKSKSRTPPSSPGGGGSPNRAASAKEPRKKDISFAD